jgi:hypothetical protein
MPTVQRIVTRKLGGAQKASFTENKGERAGQPDRPLCSRNARPQKDEEGSGQVPSLLAERAR